MSEKDNARESNKVEILTSPVGLGDIRAQERLITDLATANLPAVETLVREIVYQNPGTGGGGGTSIVAATVVTYNAVTRLGTATLSTGGSVSFINATKLGTVPGDDVLVAEITSGSYAMVGLLSQTNQLAPVGTIVPQPTLNYPVDLAALTFPVDAVGVLDISFDRTGLLGLGTDTFVARGATNTASVASVDLSTETSVPAPPLGAGRFFTEDGVILASTDAVDPATSYNIWDPITGWAAFTNIWAPATPARRRNLVDHDNEVIWRWASGSTTTSPASWSGTGTQYFANMVSGVLTNQGSLGLPSATTTPIAPLFPAAPSGGVSSVGVHTSQGNGWLLFRSGNNYWVKDATDASNFVQVSTGVATLPAAYCAYVDPAGAYFDFVQAGTAAAVNWSRFTFASGATTSLALNILPASTHVSAITHTSSSSNALVLVCWEPTLNFLDAPVGALSTWETLCVYVFDLATGVSTRVWYDHDVIGNRSLGTRHTFGGFCRNNGNVRFAAGGAVQGRKLYELSGL
jgi:hypothetical protein